MTFYAADWIGDNSLMRMLNHTALDTFAWAVRCGYCRVSSADPQGEFTSRATLLPTQAAKDPTAIVEELSEPISRQNP